MMKKKDRKGISQSTVSVFDFPANLVIDRLLRSVASRETKPRRRSMSSAEAARCCLGGKPVLLGPVRPADCVLQTNMHGRIVRRGPLMLRWILIRSPKESYIGEIDMGLVRDQAPASFRQIPVG